MQLKKSSKRAAGSRWSQSNRTSQASRGFQTDYQPIRTGRIHPVRCDCLENISDFQRNSRIGISLGGGRVMNKYKVIYYVSCHSFISQRVSTNWDGSRLV